MAQGESQLCLCAGKMLFFCAVKLRESLAINSKIVQARGNFCDIIKEKSLKQSIMMKYNL